MKQHDIEAKLTRQQVLRLGLVAVAAAVAAPRAGAQEADHAGHDAAVGGDVPASTQGYTDASARMHAAMEIDYSGDADVDFARSMIPHHQGAIDMARVMLANGQDPELKQLATEIIDAQQEEIAFLINWLDQNGG